jgi:hypothetical protein
MVQQATQLVSHQQAEARSAVERIGAFAAAAQAQQLKPENSRNSFVYRLFATRSFLSCKCVITHCLIFGVQSKYALVS